MVNKTQFDWVIDRITKSGYVTRNQALKAYISRLGAIIFKLKREGYRFDGFYEPCRKPDGTAGRDFKYLCYMTPKKK